MRPLQIAMLGVKSVPTAGGIATYTEEISSRLASRGHEVTVYCRAHYLDDPSCPPYQGVQRKTSPGLEGRCLDAATHTLTASIDAMLGGFDILHIHGLAPGFVTPLARMFSRKRIVLTVHACDWLGSKWGRLASYSMKQAAHVALRLSHRITTVSQGLQHYLQSERGCPATYTPPGVRIPDIASPREILKHGIEPGGYVLCVSRLMPEKGIHYAVEAFERLDTDKTLVIAGNCPYECDYVNELKAHAGDRIKFLGYVSGRLLEELYSNARVFLQPSDLEGLPIAVLEAMSYGRCVLASDIAQNLECLGGHGHTFQAGDVADLTTKLDGLLGNPAVAERDFLPCRQYVAREFDWERTTDAFEEVYDSCLDAAPVRAEAPVRDSS